MKEELKYRYELLLAEMGVPANEKNLELLDSVYQAGLGIKAKVPTQGTVTRAMKDRYPDPNTDKERMGFFEGVKYILLDMGFTQWGQAIKQEPALPPIPAQR